MSDYVNVEINTLANHCGYFNGKTNVNNGYGCDHPEQEETEDIELEDGRMVCQGKCYAFSCPIGWLDDSAPDKDVVQMSLDDALELGLTESDYDEVEENEICEK